MISMIEQIKGSWRVHRWRWLVGLGWLGVFLLLVGWEASFHSRSQVVPAKVVKTVRSRQRRLLVRYQRPGESVTRKAYIMLMVFQQYEPGEAVTLRWLPGSDEVTLDHWSSIYYLTTTYLLLLLVALLFVIGFTVFERVDEASQAPQEGSG